jgi:hypothetical protein
MGNKKRNLLVQFMWVLAAWAAYVRALALVFGTGDAAAEAYAVWRICRRGGMFA